MKYILSLDQGTSSSRAILFDKTAKSVATDQNKLNSTYPQEDWVEQDPIEIWESQLKSAHAVIKSIKNVDCIEAIGISNQRETSILWDKTTGEPIYNAIVWQDQRTKLKCQSLKPKFQDIIHRKTGLIIDPYFSATKIEWILDHVEGARAKAEKGQLCFGTVDSWLVWKLTKGQVHITDVSNASRTMLFNIKTLKWDEELLELFNIPKAILPKVVASSTQFGSTHPDIFGRSIPITGIAGDQQAALFGQNCWQAGSAKNTYGTGCFMLMNTGETIKYSNKGLLSTIAWQIDNKTTYALEGSVFMAGATINWLKDQLGLIENVKETEDLAFSVKDNGGVYIVPAFSGLGAPYWDTKSNGMVKGLKLSSNKAHIVRASLESIAYRTMDILSLMQKESGIKLKSLRVDGGMAENQFLMQFQADILNILIHIPKHIESSALGAAFLAGLGSQFWTMKDINNLNPMHFSYSSKMEITESENYYSEWKKAVENLLSFEE